MTQSTPFFPTWIENISTRGSLPALKFKKGKVWQEITWSQYAEMLEQIASAMIELGLKPGDRVALFSTTRYEWALIDSAALSMGIVIVPLYHTMTGEELEFILNNSESRMLIAENPSLYRIFRSVAKHCPTIEKVVLLDKTLDSTTSHLQERDLIAFEDFRKKGIETLPQHRGEWRQRLRALTLDSPATIIYTSGTTGQPKGVLITHRQVASEVNESFAFVGVTHHDISLTFLPYSHVFGRIELWGSLAWGYTLAFAESIEKIRTNLREIRPTIMIAVPRIFEKIYAAVQAQVETNPLRRKMFLWALDIGKVVGGLKLARRPIPLRLLPQFELADRLVLSKIRDAFGGRLRFAVSGGAPLNADIAHFFHSAGVLILEGYGLTETTAAVCVNTPFDYVFGTVGKPIGDVQLKIADDGEILVKSNKVMREYFHDKEATAQVFDDGWFKTGDIGEILATGQLKITDRKKDLIKTAGGKYVAPQKLEGLLKNNPLISHAHIHGDQKKYVVALVTLDFPHLRQFAQERGLPVPSSSDLPGMENLVKAPLVQDNVRKAVAEANSQLASYETIKRFVILAQDFSIESGELTPSLKIKRRVVDEKFKNEIDSLYV